MKQKNIIYNDGEKLNLRFYERYDENFLSNKAFTLFNIAMQKEKYKDFLKSIDVNPEEADEKYFEALRAEIHFTEFHQFESLFALLMAIFQGLPHWLFLTTYDTRFIKESVKKYLDRKIQDLSENKCQSVKDFIIYTIYSNFSIQDTDKWKENFNNLEFVIDRMARKYLEGNEYNAYKHGLRVFTGPSFIKIAPNNNPQNSIQFASEDSISFLETRRLKSEEVNQQQIETTFETTKHFSLQESVNHLEFMRAILKNIKSSRLARLKGEKGAPIDLLMGIDKDGLYKIRKSTVFSFSV